MAEKGLAVGIDLGTTNSCMAFLNGDVPQVIPNSDGYSTTPSVVALTDQKNWLVGLDAKHQSITNPKRTVASIKRFIGLKINDDDVQRDQSLVSYDIEGAENNDLRIKLGDQPKSPEEISAIILQKLRMDAEARLGSKVNQAVVTVPAYFNDSQRQATKDAGKIAGFEVLRIINEPTAAALAYDFDSKRNQKIAVYDLGGGTLDVTVLEMLNGLYRVLSTSGDTHLGGDDFDYILMEWVLAKFYEGTAVDLRKEPAALQRLREASEKAKCDLSTETSVEINLPFITKKEGIPLNLSYTLTRADFEKMVNPLVERSIEPCKKALKDANLTTNDLNEVILVGGMTRMPKIREVVKKFYGKDPNTQVNPDESVALGAAIQAGILNGHVRTALLLDVTPLSLGVETLGGVFSVIIPRNTTVPTKMSKLYSTVKDMQTSVNIKVLQGESKVATNNKTLGFFSFIGLPAALAGEAQIEVTFAIDANGIVNVTAKNVASGQTQQMKVSATSGLSKDELENLVKTAKDRVIFNIPKEQPREAPVMKGDKKPGKPEPELKGTVLPAASVTKGAVPPAASFTKGAAPVDATPKVEVDGEFLTADMIDSLLKDKDEH